MNKISLVISNLNFIPRQGVNPFIQAERGLGKTSNIVQRQYNKVVKPSLKIPEIKLIRQPKTDEFAGTTIVQDAAPLIVKKRKVHQNVNKQALAKYFDNSKAVEENNNKPLSKKDFIKAKQQWYDNIAEEYNLKEKQDFKNLEEKYIDYINLPNHNSNHGFEEKVLKADYELLKSDYQNSLK